MEFSTESEPCGNADAVDRVVSISVDKGSTGTGDGFVVLKPLAGARADPFFLAALVVLVRALLPPLDAEPGRKLPRVPFCGAVSGRSRLEVSLLR